MGGAALAIGVGTASVRQMSTEMIPSSALSGVVASRRHEITGEQGTDNAKGNPARTMCKGTYLYVFENNGRKKSEPIATSFLYRLAVLQYL